VLTKAVQRNHLSIEPPGPTEFVPADVEHDVMSHWRELPWGD